MKACFLSSSQSLDNKPPPRACQWSTVSHPVCFLGLITLLLIRFRHFYQFPFSFDQTMVQDRVQPLYCMASSPAHDSFLQEANTLYSFCILMQKMGVASLGRHIRPACNQALLAMCWLKKVDVDLHRVCFSWLLGCEGSGATFRSLRMRSRSTRK